MGISEELHDAVEEIKVFVDERMKVHEQAFHDYEAERIFYNGGTPMSVARIVEEHVRMNSDITEIADAFLGTPRTALMGGGRSGDGVVATVESQKTRLEEIAKSMEYLTKKADEPSVTKIRFSPGVWVAFISGMAAVIVALIQNWN